MLGHRELTMEDYAGILKRRFWLILTSAVLLLGVGVGISYYLPPQYVSQTLVLIEQQKVPEDYVKPVVDEDLGARLASMKEQILSRSRIQPIIERFDLYAGKNTTMDDRVDMTRKSIGINPIRSEQSHGMPGFFISFKAKDAHTAQQVCGEITSLFVSANLNAREESAEGTTDFLKQQLAEAKRNLDDQDARLASFEQKNIGRLPGQTIKFGDMSLAMGSSNESTLQALTSQLNATTQTENRLQQEETFLQAMIAQQGEDSKGAEAGSGPAEDERKKQLKDLLKQKQDLQALYTPDYPDVVAISRKIADLKAEIAHAPAETAPAAASDAASAKPHDSPRLQQLKLQLKAGQQALANAKQEQSRIEEQIRTYEARIEASPIIEEEYKAVTRDHDTALQFYNTLLTKMNESSMATALEHRQQGEQFRVMDAPNLPDSPTFPNRFVFAFGGLGSGLVLGLLLVALLEYRDTSLRNERDIWAFTKLPTLAVVSHIDDLAYPVPARKFLGIFSRTPKPIESAHG
ncbi:MAG: Wzz/FepE/Etk N-terminal domain-containing protein [Terracidiphilus sp.]|jgi:polysaccharide chain length determinant protein (PEP-CTERM system associated)